MDYVLNLVLIIIVAIFVNNVVLAQFLGICPFLGVSKKVDTASGMGMAVTAVLVVATIVTYLIQVYVLNVFGLEYLQTIAFILVIASLVSLSLSSRKTTTCLKVSSMLSPLVSAFCLRWCSSQACVSNWIWLMYLSLSVVCPLRSSLLPSLQWPSWASLVWMEA